MADRVRQAEATRYHLPLVLCCAEDDEVALARVLDELHREGVAPEIVLGVELDPEVLTRAVDRMRGPALFVLCGSPNLDRNHLRRLAGLFSARRAAEHRLTQVQLAAGRPLAILPVIRDAMKELRESLYQNDGDEDNGALLRDVVGPTSVSALPKRPDPPMSNAEQMALEMQRELEEAEAILERRRVRNEAKPAPQPGRRPIAPLPSDSSSQSRAAAASAASSSTMPRAAASSASNPLSAAAASRSAPVPGPAPAKAPAAVTQTDEIVVPSRAPAPEKSGRSSVIPIALGVAAVGALAIVLWQALDRGDEGGSRKLAPTAPAATPAKSTNDPAPDPTPDPPPAEAPVTAPAPTPTPTAEPTPAPAPEPTKPVPAELPPPPHDATTAEASPLDRAVDEGKLRLVGNLVVVPPGRDEMTWPDASQTCATRRVAKIGGFRLPTRAEMGKLAAANVLGDGAFWTRDRVSDDEAYAYDRAAAKSHVWLTVEPNGRAVCVKKKS